MIHYSVHIDGDKLMVYDFVNLRWVKHSSEKVANRTENLSVGTIWIEDNSIHFINENKEHRRTKKIDFYKGD